MKETSISYYREKLKERKQMMESENTPSVQGNNDEPGEGEGEESRGGEVEENGGKEHYTNKNKSFSSTNTSGSDRSGTANSQGQSSSSGWKTVSTTVTSRNEESPPGDDIEHSVALREPLMDDDFMF